MGLLDTIIKYKESEVAFAKQLRPEAVLLNGTGFLRSTLSLREFLMDENRTGIIAEFKRKSPSKGVINETADVVSVTRAYADNGASGLSVLTDEYFFGGTATDLQAARVQAVPILRKDFIIDEYQILESRAMGADVILLIAACLTPKRVKSLTAFAHSLQLEVLLEIHSEDELQHIGNETDLVGINNRDLQTFEVNINRALLLAKKIPGNVIKIAESGISNVETVCTFRRAGYKGFLIGENFMQQPDPGAAFAAFVNNLKQSII